MSGISQPPTDQAPGCAWHPDRETYISCARCGRPICPDCMTAAPVGFQCPDCVRQAQDQVVQTRTAPVTGRVITPYVTWTLIGLCIAVYVAEMALGVDALAANWGMQPLAIAWEGQWYRLITPVFLHASLLHLGFNMYILFVVGQPLERLFGHARFLVLFLLAGLGGAVASYAFSDPQTLSVGASGAIFGLMGALVVAGRSMQFDVRQVGVLILINIVIGFVPGWNIDWRAHLGGLVVGAAAAWVLLRSSRTSGQPRPTGRGAVSAASLAGLAAVLLVIIGVAAWRTNQLQQALQKAPSVAQSVSAPAEVTHRLSTGGDRTTQM